MRRLASPALGLGVALGLLAAGSPARAQPSPPRTSSLSWTRLDGAGECVGIRELARAVEARLRREVFASPRRAGAAVEAWIAPAAAPDRWRAVLQISDEKGAVVGTRELRSDAPSCRALDAQLALVIAVLIDPDAALAGAPREAAAPAPARPDRALAAAPVPTAPAPAAPPPARFESVTIPAPLPAWRAPLPARTPWATGVEGGAVFAFGSLPGTAVGIAIRGHLTPPHGPTFELGATTWLPAEARDGALGVRLSLTDGFLSVCPLKGATGGVRLAACAGVRGGLLHAVGFGFQRSADGDHAVVDVSAGGRIRAHLAGPLVASLGLDLLVPLTRYRFSYQTAAGQTVDAFRAWPIAAALDAGVGLAFF